MTIYRIRGAEVSKSKSMNIYVQNLKIFKQWNKRSLFYNLSNGITFFGSPGIECSNPASNKLNMRSARIAKAQSSDH